LRTNKQDIDGLRSEGRDVAIDEEIIIDGLVEKQRRLIFPIGNN